MPDLIRTRLQIDPRAFASHANQTRTPGIHLTEILHDLEFVKNGMRSIYEGNGFTDSDLDDFALQGFLWEDVVTRALVNKVRETGGAAIGAADYESVPELALHIDCTYAFRLDDEFKDLPQEVQAALVHDCILMTPDGLRRDPRRLLECKWTTKSANFNPEAAGDKGKRIWFHQVKGYLLGLSVLLREFIGDVEWHVQFPRGTYRGDEPPIYERWDKQYERDEIMATWSMVVQHLRWRTSAEGGDPHNWGQHLTVEVEA